jgi:hypothetical protein
MIPVNDDALYRAALQVINKTVGTRYLGRVAQIFLACKHYGRYIPQIGDAVGIKSGDIEDFLDDLYIKPTRTQPDKILILFDDAYKIKSGETGGVLSSPSNVWRNNLNLQKGYMCYASVRELQDRAFLLQSRSLCPHLNVVTAGKLVGASCSLKPGGSGENPPRYRAEDHAKMFRKDPASGEYFVHDPTDIDFYRPLILPSNGRKLPIIAIIIALYHGGLLAGGRDAVTIDDFLTDFDFTSIEAGAYFEDDPASDAHAALLLVRPDMSWDPVVNIGVVQAATHTLPGPVSGIAPIPTPNSPAIRNRRGLPSVIAGTTSAPPASGFWWDAQQAVRQLLVDCGWTVIDMSALGVGYDLKATKGTTMRLVEVKSSVGPCAPTLTAREYHEACQARGNYVLAIVEHFNVAKPATVQWVQDPAALGATIRQVSEYYLPRSVWKGSTISSP